MPESTKKKAAAKKAAAPKRTTAKSTATSEATRPPATAPARTNRTGQPRLAKGALEALVLDHLKKHPSVEFTPTELSNKLHRSSGAISNALERLTAKGSAVETKDAPRTFRYAGKRAAPKASGTRKAR
jgi:hypothetical protein